MAERYSDVVPATRCDAFLFEVTSSGATIDTGGVMQPLYEMKGLPRHVLGLKGPGGAVELVSYADGSYGIFHEGVNVGTWEPSELLECVSTFAILGGVVKGRFAAIDAKCLLRYATGITASRCN